MDQWRKGVFLAGLLFMIAGLLLTNGEDNIEQSRGRVLTCATVTQNTLSCLPFLRGPQPAKPPRNSPCCAGIRYLDKAAAVSLRHRRKICTCLERGARTYKPNPRSFAGLPGACGASYTFSLHRNCNKIR